MNPAFHRPDWQKRAACRGKNPDIFFPKRGESLDAAQEICRDCPVRKNCELHYILYNEDYGVWAGLGKEGRNKRIQQLIDSGDLDPTLVGSKKKSTRD